MLNRLLNLFWRSQPSLNLCRLQFYQRAAHQDIQDIEVLFEDNYRETDDYFDVENLDGVVFPPRANSVLVLDQPILDAGTIIFVPPGRLPVDPDALSQEISDPINITFDGRANRLFFYERESSELVAIYLRGRLLSPNAIQRFQANEYGVVDPSGMTVDPKTGTLFFLDGFGPKIVRVDPGPDRKNYDGAAALEEGRISESFLQQSQGPLRGLGYNHADGCLYVFSPSMQELYTITEDIELVSVGDL